MPTFDIRREDGETKGRLFLIHDGAEAELTYSILSPHSRIADHTGVPDALRGTRVPGARLSSGWWRTPAPKGGRSCRCARL